MIFGKSGIGNTTKHVMPGSIYSMKVYVKTITNNSAIIINARICFLVTTLMIVLILPAASQSTVQIYPNPENVDLLTAGNFRILARNTATIGNGTTVTGDVGVSPGASVINNGIVNGAIHLNDVSAIQAQRDLIIAYNDAAGRTVDATVNKDLGGTTLGRGVYVSDAGTFRIAGDLTLNGTANDIFIFKMATTLTTEAGSSVVLTGGAVPSNVFWQVGSSATIDGDLKGNMLASADITQYIGGSVIHGKALSRNNFVTLIRDANLPVKLISFTATANKMNTDLRWSTATEVHNYGFEIERRQNANWDKVEFVAGAGTSNSPREYCYTDNNLLPGHYTYRIKRINNNGAFLYHGSVEVDIAGAMPQNIPLLQNSPDPLTPSTNIHYRLESADMVTLKIFNSLGHEVATLVDGPQEAGSYTIMFNTNKKMRSLPSGEYFYRIESGSFVSSEKLILMN